MATAQDILASYHATQRVLRRPCAWLSLLEVAAAGTAGIYAVELSRRLDRSRLAAKLLRLWEASGLITVERILTPRGGRPLRLIRPTAKLYTFLRLQAPA